VRQDEQVEQQRAAGERERLRPGDPAEQQREPPIEI
jgi:hypothetical protein